MELSAQLIECGVAGLMPTIALAAALGRALHHLRISRVARFADEPGAAASASIGMTRRPLRGHPAIREGFALLRGTVIDEDDAPPGPALRVDFPVLAPEWPGDQRAPPCAEARPFSLRLASGAVVRVDPEPGRWTLDTTFHTVLSGTEARYEATIDAGDEVYVAGQVQREIDPRATGKGYRDAAQAWIVRAPARGELTFSSASVIAKHARRVRFHAAWALALAAVGVWAEQHVIAHAHGIVLALIAGIGALAMYELYADATEPWLVRKPQSR